MSTWCDLVQERSSFPVPSTHHQTLLSKSIFEHCLDYAQVASIALASKSIQNSSLSANFASKLIINKQSVTILNTVFHPSTSLPVQFTPELILHDQLPEIIRFFTDMIKTTEYFRQSLRRLTLKSFSLPSVFREWFNFGLPEGDEPPIIVCSALEKLTLIDCEIAEDDEEDSVADFINSSSAFPRLESVEITVNYIDNDAVDLRAATKINKLTSLVTESEHLSDHHVVNHISKKCKNLKTLRLHEVININDESLTALSASFWGNEDTEMKHLEITMCENFSSLRPLLVPSSPPPFSSFCLISLSLQGSLSETTMIGSEADWTEIWSSPACRTLEQVDLWGCETNDAVVVPLAKVLYKTITSLDLCATVIFDRGLDAISKCTGLKKLNLAGSYEGYMTNFTWSGLCRMLPQLVNLERLNLDFRGSAISNEVWPHILKHNTKTLKSFSGIGYSSSSDFVHFDVDEEASSSSSHNVFENLEDIILSGLSNQQLQRLAKFCPNLKSLHLTPASSITDEGCLEICKTKCIENLRLFACTNITNICVKALLKNLPRLRTLDMSFAGEKVTDAAFLGDDDDSLKHSVQKLSQLNVYKAKGVSFDFRVKMSAQFPRLKVIA